MGTDLCRSQAATVGVLQKGQLATFWKLAIAPGVHIPREKCAGDRVGYGHGWVLGLVGKWKV